MIDIGTKNIISTTIHLIPGSSISISCDDYFVKTGEQKLPYTNRVVELLRGYALDNPNVGDLIISSSQDAEVIYTHRKPEKNIIWFFALTGEVGKVDVISVEIHDHSSIVQGGPAYGTYFTDDDLE